jgi:hypothetical protein
MHNSAQRAKIIEARYGRKPVGPGYVYRLLVRSIRTGQAVSVIRLGDVMAKLLARKNIQSLFKVSSFLGIKLPPSPQMMRELDWAVRSANVVGLTHLESSIDFIKLYMQRSNWSPPIVADSFINDLLYERGYLQRLLRRYRTALVGRAAPTAARQLRRQGIRVALTVPLDNYEQLPNAVSVLARNSKNYDFVLVGASVPGRILCPIIAKQLGKSAIEIGHMMDAMSHPRTWASREMNNSRRFFKARWIKRLKRDGASGEEGRIVARRGRKKR